MAIFGHLVLVVDEGDPSAVFRVMWLRTQGGARQFRFCRGAMVGVRREACTSISYVFLGCLSALKNFAKNEFAVISIWPVLRVGVEYQEPPRSLSTVLCEQVQSCRGVLSS